MGLPLFVRFFFCQPRLWPSDYGYLDKLVHLSFLVVVDVTAAAISTVIDLGGPMQRLEKSADSSWRPVELQAVAEIEIYARYRINSIS